MKAADLRKSILQAAVQGKLVPQDKNDEPASELLKRIQVEKAKLVKEGKLKKEKPLPPITEGEIPYDLPEGWAWCRLGRFISLISGQDFPPNQYNDKHEGIPYLTGASNLQKGALVINRWTESARCITVPDDILIVCKGSGVGKMAFVPAALQNAHIARQLMAIRLLPSTNVDRIYVQIAVQAMIQDIRDQMQGVIPGISRDIIQDLPFPLPPLAEQQRIVAKVDELMALCDELEAVEKDLNTLETHFVKCLPKSILQAAAQGKLVPQDTNDEPASELLKRIKAEKNALIKDGKLKKERPLPQITEDEIPYDLPEGWAWCRLGDIHQICRGITFPASVKKEQAADGNVRCATTGSVQHLYNPAADVFIPKSYVKRDDQWLQANDIIMSTANSRELVGKTCVWDADERMTFGGFLTVIRAGKATIPFFSYYALQYFQKTGAFNVSSTQTTNIANINNEILLTTLFPLPALAEQQRIVTKADELMALCDELKRVGEQPINHSKVVSFPAAVKIEAETLQMAAQGKVSDQPSKKHVAALDYLVELMGDD